MGQTYYQANSWANVDKEHFPEIRRLLERREEGDDGERYCQFMKDEGIWTDSFIWPDFDFELEDDGLCMYVEEYGELENILEFGRLLIRRGMTNRFEYIGVQYGEFLDGRGVVIDEHGEHDVQLLGWVLNSRYKGGE